MKMLPKPHKNGASMVPWTARTKCAAIVAATFLVSIVACKPAGPQSFAGLWRLSGEFKTELRIDVADNGGLVAEFSYLHPFNITNLYYGGDHIDLTVAYPKPPGVQQTSKLILRRRSGDTLVGTWAFPEGTVEVHGELVRGESVIDKVKAVLARPFKR